MAEQATAERPVIRPEREEEFAAIYNLVKTAFASARVSDGDEQEYVNRLRAGDSYIPALALVALSDGRPVGHIMLTRVGMKTDDGRDVKTLLLAPLSVLPGHQGRGIGRKLVQAALARARDLQYDAVFLVGEPSYYSRFGFRLAGDFGIVYTGKVPPEFVQAIELRPGALRRGSINVEENLL